ncbi:hypothetical protein EYF80_053570 [Liparis tanakae]|uniref:Uncharacterized protein n=1 Tax=Liparis tanakae TaxID=230148 RepID=A0A4Z2F573_9TELE|nr:hypothetical protein EYF80_053570 [Liparis tanakae]
MFCSLLQQNGDEPWTVTEFLSTTVRSPSITAVLVVHPIPPGPNRHQLGESAGDPVPSAVPCSIFFNSDPQIHGS